MSGIHHHRHPHYTHGNPQPRPTEHQHHAHGRPASHHGHPMHNSHKDEFGYHTANAIEDTITAIVEIPVDLLSSFGKTMYGAGEKISNGNWGTGSEQFILSFGKAGEKLIGGTAKSIGSASSIIPSAVYGEEGSVHYQGRRKHRHQ